MVVSTETMTSRKRTLSIRVPEHDIELLRQIADTQASTVNRLIVTAVRDRLATYRPNEAWRQLAS